MDATNEARHARRQAEAASQDAARNPWVQRIARAGFYARAAVYVVIGGLALALAAGAGGRTTDTRGAITTLSGAPFGKWIVVAMAAGLAGLSLWHLLAALADPDGAARRSEHAWAVRFARAAVCVTYAALSWFALRLALGSGGGRSSGNASARSWTAKALELPLGTVLVAIAGGVFLAIGARRIWKGMRRDYTRHLETGRMGPIARRWLDPSGRLGFSAQGVVTGLVGVYLVFAAIRHDPHEATGFDGALASLARQPFGMALLAAVAVGLLAYAAFSVLEGRYRRLGGP